MPTPLPTDVTDAGLDGESGSIAVDDPATGAVIGSVPVASRRQIDGAVRSALQAGAGWAGLDDAARGAALRQASKVLTSHARELAALVTAEQGKPTALATGESLSAATAFRDATRTPLDPVSLPGGRQQVTVERRAHGTIAVITPWNFPLAIAAAAIAPALRLGNTVVLKPSPVAPMAAQRMVELLAAVLPAGALTVVHGGAAAGKALVEHPGVAKVCFTGSVGNGRAVALAAAATPKPAVLELGGNDPAVVLEDLDVAAAAADLFWGACTNSGQGCTAIKRVYAVGPVAAALTEALAALAGSVRVGPGAAPGTELAPVTTLVQVERLAGMVHDARTRGATIVVGGPEDSPGGRLLRPVVAARAEDGMTLVDDEQFLPALPVVTCRDEAEAVARANRGGFGLSASVWSADVERAAAVAARLDAGTTWVNSHGGVVAGQPTTGTGLSGYGSQGGIWGLHELSHPRVSVRPLPAGPAEA